MKIVIVTNEFDIESGGLAYSCRTFSDMLERLGHSVVILSSHLPIQNTIQGGYLPNLGYEIAMEEKIKSDAKNLSDFTLIISFGGGFNGYYGALLTNKLNVRFWVMFRGSDANISKWNPTTIFYNKIACESAEKIICLSGEIATNVQEFGTRRNKIVVIPNPAIRKVCNIKSFEGEEILLGTGATHLNEKKGVSKLIEMLSFLKANFPQKTFRLELVGHIDEDVLKQYCELANRNEVSGLIDFRGRMKREEFRVIQSNWNIYIQASVCEGMGNSVVDAMSLGIPVMLTNTGFVAEYAQTLFPGMIFKSFQPNIMAENLIELIDSNNVLSQYSNFYTNFFELINPLKIESTWTDLLSYKQPTCYVSHFKNSILVVSLHDVAGTYHDNITTPVSVFLKFVDDVYNAGYRLCSMIEYMNQTAEARRNLIVCTYDDGYEGLIKNAFPIMEKYGFSATVYVCTDYFGKINDWNYKDKSIRRHLTVEELLTLQSHGWEIGSHGITHKSLLRLSDDEVVNQLALSKEILEGIFGPVFSYAYPYGDFSPFIEEQVKKYYNNAVLLKQGGVFLPVDTHKIHRYYISEIYQIIRCL